MTNKVFELKSPIGLVAGGGNFPLEFLRAATVKNLEVYVVAYHNESDSKLAELCKKITWIKVGQLNKMLAFFKKNNVRQISILGGIKRARLFKELWPDWRAMRMIAGLKSLKDDEVLRALANTLEEQGIKVFSASELLTDCIARAGLITSRSLSDCEVSDAKLAWQAAKAIGSLDIGQAAVAYQGTVVALEAVEGTDNMLSRVAGLLSTANNKIGEGAVLVKTAKPNQDLRLDLPAVGLETLRNMHAAGVTALVLEADKALICTAEEFLNYANSLKIAVQVWEKG